MFQGQMLPQVASWVHPVCVEKYVFNGEVDVTKWLFSEHTGEGFQLTETGYRVPPLLSCEQRPQSPQEASGLMDMAKVDSLQFLRKPLGVPMSEDFQPREL